MSKALLSMKSRNRLFAWIEEWPYEKRHEEFVDAGFDDYGYRPLTEEDWEHEDILNQRDYQEFKGLLDWQSAETLKKLVPVIQTVINETADLSQRQEFISYLQTDGFTFADGRVAYADSINSAKQLVDMTTRFDAHYMRKQLVRIEASIDSDPSLAIGSAKELVETCCKTILNERNVQVDSGWDVPQLVKATVRELKLTPDDIPAPTQDTANARKAVEAMKTLLMNLASIAGKMAELRNAVGTGHGPDGRAKGPRPRHARLAVNATVALVMFLFETHVAKAKVAQKRPEEVGNV